MVIALGLTSVHVLQATSALTVQAAVPARTGSVMMVCTQTSPLPHLPEVVLISQYAESYSCLHAAYSGQSGNGACSSCDGGYAGANCDVSILLVVVPTVLATLACLSALIIFTVWYMKRSASIINKCSLVCTLSFGTHLMCHVE